MKLTSNDYQNIASQIERGFHTIEFEKDGEILNIEYNYVLEGYQDRDYYNGTGEYIVENQEFWATAESYNEDGDKTENDFNEDELFELIAA